MCLSTEHIPTPPLHISSYHITQKELKKLAKAQAQAAQAGLPIPTGPVGAPQPNSTSAASTINAATSFPPTSSAPTPQAGIRRPQTPASMGVGTPRPQGPGPGPPHGGGRPGTPVARPGSADALAKRGKKRELEDDTVGAARRAGLPGGGTPGTPGMGLPVGAGVGMARPGSGMQRPMKKPRTVRPFFSICVCVLFAFARFISPASFPLLIPLSPTLLPASLPSLVSRLACDDVMLIISPWASDLL